MKVCDDSLAGAADAPMIGSRAETPLTLKLLWQTTSHWLAAAAVLRSTNTTAVRVSLDSIFRSAVVIALMLLLAKHGEKSSAERLKRLGKVI